MPCAHTHLIVLVDEVQATIVGDEGGDLLAVLDELHADALANGRVGLLGLNTDLLDDDAGGVGGTVERVGLERGEKVLLLVALVRPPVLAALVAHLAPGADSTRLAC